MYLSKKLIFWNRGNNILQELSLPCCCESNGIIYLRNAALARCFHSSREINKDSNNDGSVCTSYMAKEKSGCSWCRPFSNG
jgi:hypothetical protein